LVNNHHNNVNNKYFKFINTRYVYINKITLISPSKTTILDDYVLNFNETECTKKIHYFDIKKIRQIFWVQFHVYTHFYF